MSAQWRAASNGASRLHFFVMRADASAYLERKDGRLVRYGSHDTARAAADRLNTSEGFGPCECGHSVGFHERSTCYGCQCVWYRPRDSKA